MRRGSIRTPASVLFLQSSRSFLADAQVHAALARELPDLGCAVFAACDPGSGSGTASCLDVFEALPDISVRPTRFGPSIEGRSKAAAAAALGLGIPSIIWSTISLSRFMRRNRIDIVHCSEKVREAVIGYAVARMSGARLVIHLHLKVENWFSGPTKWIMHRADRLLAISEFVAASAVEMGYAPSRISTALNGLTIPLDDFNMHPGDRQWVTEEFGIPAEALIICIAARINRWKGHRRLLDSLAAIADAAPPFFLIAAGRDDPNETSPEHTIAALTSHADVLGLGDRLVFTGFRNDLRRIIRACDIFAMPSFEEPFGLVYIEAMAAAKPVVALKNGGTPEVVIDGQTGLLSDADDEQALADHLLTLLKDAGLRQRLGDAGRTRAVERFTTRRMASDVLASYRTL